MLTKHFSQNRLLLSILILSITAFTFYACSEEEEDVVTSNTTSSSTEETTSSSSEETTSSSSEMSEDVPSYKAMKLKGDIEIDGSSTVFPITQAVAEEFMVNYQPDVRVTVGVSGTGGGMKRFTVGETSISNASRPIKDKEAAAAKENGIEFTELTVAYDGLSVVINKDNDWVDCLTVEQLNMMWRPENPVNKWSEIDSSWPDVEFNLYGPGTDSGTFDYFTDEINGDEGVSRADYVASEDDNILVTGVAGDKNSLAYFGYAYYIENKDKIKVVKIDGGDGCIEPSLETVADGSYSPLARPIFIYANNAHVAEKPEVAAFLEYYLTEGTQYVSEVGYVPIGEANYQKELEKIKNPTSSSSEMSEDVPSYKAMKLKGDIEIDGSSTVFPITQAVAEEFMVNYQPDVRVTVGVSGTGGGMKRFTVGETSISNASRPIKDKEAAAAKENGIEFTELTVAYDGLSVVINKDNDWVDCLTVEQLNMMWRPENPVNKWSEIDSSWPDVEFNLYGPGTDSGTFDYFTDEINGDEGVSRADYVASEDDNILVTGVAGDKNSLAYFGYAYYIENKDKIKVVKIDGGDGCIEPSLETVADGSYSPLARPIFIYANNAHVAEKPEVAAFLEYYLTEGTQYVSEVGYVPIGEANYQKELEKIK